MPKTPPLTLASLPLAGEDERYLVIGPMCWGKHIDPRRALARAKRELPRSLIDARRLLLFRVYRTAPDAYVSGVGALVSARPVTLVETCTATGRLTTL